MAEDFAIGRALVIPQSVMNNLNEIDKKINLIASDSEKMATHFTSAMTRMSGSTGDLIQKLQSIHGLVGSIGNINIKGLDTASTSMGKTATEAEKAANNITQAATSINKMGSGMNIAELTSNIKELNKQLTSGSGIQSMSEQQQVVNKLRELQAELVVQKKSENQIDEENLKNAQRKQNNLDKLVESYEKINKVNLSSQSKEEQDLANWVLSKKKEQASLEEQTAKTSEKYKKAEQERVENIFKIENEKRELQRKSYEEALKYADKLDKKEEEYRKKKQAALEKEVSQYEKQQMSSSRVPSSATEKQTLSWIESQKKKEIEAQNELERISQEYAAKEQARVEEIARIEDERRKQKRASYEESLKYAQELDKKEEAAAKKRLDEINKEYQAQARLDSQLRKSNYQSYVTSTEGSLRTADKANTYAQRAQAIKNLEEAIKKLRTTDANYQKDLQRLSDAHKRLSNEQKKVEANFKSIQSSQSRLMNTSGQLARQLALIFSVSQIEGYISKLVKVRGEFELQNTALASILQNKDQADKLFGQITELAVKSPFTVKELTTYTKSLSAYQVEYEKLYDTTKMLADVSAGLGVDMQRLILAFGQVKAANFLRGTETRQFTEAGINMLGELAKYYSELEDRIVSVGEVQERQFKRMISFADVEEVFKRLTSAGGMFYEMQEKQSETLWGLMSNLKDSIDIMLNDIGMSNQDLLKGIIEFLKSIIENWKTISQISVPILSNLILYVSLTKGWSAASKLLPNLYLKIGTALEQIKLSLTAAGRAQKGFNASTAKNAWLAIGLTVATIIWEVVSALKAAREEQEKLDKIASEGYFSSLKSTAEYKRLADIVSDVTASYQEQQDALDQLKRLYGEILPKHNLEAEAIRAMKGNYDEATAAIENYIRAKTQEKQLQSISEVYEEKVQDKQGDLASQIQKQVEKLYDYKLAISEINVILSQFRKEFDEGMIKSPEEARKRINELLSIYLGKDVQVKLGKSVGGDMFRRYEDYAVNYFNSLVELKQKTDEVINSSSIVFGDRITIDLQNQRKELQKQLDETKSLLNTISKEGQIGREGSVITKEQVEEAKVRLTEIVKQWGVDASYISKLTGDAFQIKKATIDINKAAIQSMADSIKNMKFTKNQVGSVFNFLEGLGDELNSLEDSNFQKFISDIVKSAAELNDISLGNLMDAFANSEETVSDYTKRIEAKLTQLKESIELFNQSPYLVPEWNLDENNLKMAEKQAAVYEAALKRVKKQEADTGGDKTNQRLKEQISLIKKAGDEYEKLTKYYSEEEATSKIRESFADAFSNLGLDITMDFDTTSIINGIENISHKAGQAGKKAIDNAVAPLKSQQDIDVRVKGLKEIQKQLDEVFAGYELSVELEKMGLDNNLISQLFDVDTFSLDDVQKNLNKLKPKLMEYGDEGYKVFSDMEKKITEMQQNELQERLKKYASYLKKSVTERVAIELEAQKEIAKVQATSELTPQQKEQVTKNIREEASKKKQEQTWNEFKDSDLYIRMFEDLESASTKSLDLMEQKLLEYRDSLKKLDPSDLKEITNLLEKMREIKIDRNPFKGFISNLKEVIEYQKQVDELNTKYYDSINEEKYLSGLVEAQELSIDAAQKRYNEQVKINGASSQEAIKAKSVLDSQQKELESTKTLLEKQKEITNEYGKQISLGDKKTAQVNEQINKIGSYGSQAINSLTELTDMLSNFGIDFGETFSGVVSGLGQAFQGLEQIDITKPMSIITGAVGVVSGIGNAIASIFGAGDKKKEREIKRQLELVENLQKSYEKLEQAIEDAYSIDTYKKSYDQTIANLEDQNEALQAAINAERAKKKTDNDRIKEWEEQYQDNLDRIQELNDEFINSLGGFGSEANVKSAAQEFADAWLEAYLETGNGLDALSEKWDEYIQGVIAKQLMLKGTEKYLKPVMDMLDSMLEDAVFSPKEATDLQNKIDEIMPLLNEFWEGIADSFDLDSLQKGDTMSSLQRGISSVSEETAQALEALLNSVRFFTSDSNTVLHNIYNAITIPNVDNPFLMELKVQSEQLRLLYGLFNGIIKNVSGSGRAMNVRIV